MTTIVAVMSHVGTAIAADTQITKGSERVHHRTRNFSKLIKLNEGCIVGYAGNAKGIQLLKKLSVDERLTPDEQVDVIYTYIWDTFKEHGLFRDKDNTMDCSLVVAFSNRLFAIDCDGCIIEYEDSAVIGSGDVYAKVVLMDSVALPLGDRVEAAMAMAAHFDIYTSPEIEIEYLWSNKDGTVRKDVNGRSRSRIARGKANPKRGQDTSKGDGSR